MILVKTDAGRRLKDAEFALLHNADANQWARVKQEFNEAWEQANGQQCSQSGSGEGHLRAVCQDS